MMGQLKSWLLNVVAWINVLLVALMLLTGFSDRIDPEHHPIAGFAGMVFPVFVAANVLMLVFWTLVRWQRLWIPVGGLLLAYAPINIYAPVRVISELPPYDLKVLSYNVGGYGSPSDHHNGFDSIFSYICHQQADIVCVQEDNGSWPRAGDRWAGHFAHNAKVKLDLEGSRWSNNVAVHTRFPIVRTESIHAPTSTRANGAVAFYLEIETDTLLLVVCHLENIHLNANDRKQYKEIVRGEMDSDAATAEGKQLMKKFGGAFKARAAQVKAISRYIDDHRRGHRVIVCGDFNDTPISFTRHTLAKGLTDCFAESGCGLGLSYNQKGFNFRIDHILCSDDLESVRCIVDSKMAQSDHYPVVCWLKMTLKP